MSNKQLEVQVEILRSAVDNEVEDKVILSLIDGIATYLKEKIEDDYKHQTRMDFDLDGDF